ncbi:cytochrome c oxidase assembly protein [Leekyejoonella antrihumi]|uniref:Cytochrome c oxidase assembly protein n=1 Tax=Leekyejoonella antrihumi TaxID=1660198 RepID=A0A563E502_9MICO|nr:cytochrome c oxidase assembly protein [Leekyejoonella antrihumi]TWP37638.1 cytochrome c oxidase assembly protein [Leekyejoonella antrihumi]
MSRFTASSWATAWTFSPFGVILALLLIGGYAVLWRAARRRGVRWPLWKTLAFLLLGVAPLLYVTCGAIGVYRTTFFWMFGAQIAVLSAVTPTGLALGDPIGLLTHVTGPDTWVHRALHSRASRVLMFPMVGSLMAVASIMLIFFTGYAQAATRSAPIGVLADLQVLIIGMLVVLPLITEDLLPAWAGPGVRTFLSIIDGLLDAIPGILVMTSFSILAPRFPGFEASAAPLRDGMTHLLDQKYTGGALLAIAEVIGIPLMGAVFVDWMRSDDAEAREADARLDEQATAVASRVADHDADPAPSDQPWWLSDPRMAGRFHRPGDDD